MLQQARDKNNKPKSVRCLEWMGGVQKFETGSLTQQTVTNHLGKISFHIVPTLLEITNQKKSDAHYFKTSTFGVLCLGLGFERFCGLVLVKFLGRT